MNNYYLQNSCEFILNWRNQREQSIFVHLSKQRAGLFLFGFFELQFEIIFWFLMFLHMKVEKNLTAVGFEPTPFRTGA